MFKVNGCFHLFVRSFELLYLELFYFLFKTYTTNLIFKHALYYCELILVRQLSYFWHFFSLSLSLSGLLFKSFITFIFSVHLPAPNLINLWLLSKFILLTIFNSLFEVSLFVLWNQIWNYQLWRYYCRLQSKMDQRKINFNHEKKNQYKLRMKDLTACSKSSDIPIDNWTSDEDNSNSWHTSFLHCTNVWKILRFFTHYNVIGKNYNIYRRFSLLTVFSLARCLAGQPCKRSTIWKGFQLFWTKVN